MSTNWIADVRAFHEAIGMPVAERLTVLGPAREKLRQRLVYEECQEFLAAVSWGDQVETADGIVDLIYVAISAALEMGVPLQAVWDEIHSSNMRKAGPDGKCKMRADGKVLKPDGWVPPDVAGVLRRAEAETADRVNLTERSA